MNESRSALLESVLTSDSFREQLGDLAARLKRPADEVLREARDDVAELSASHQEAVLRRWNRFGDWMMRGYDRLIDEEGLSAIRALDSGNSLAFLISHRSYLDEWALPPALVELGIQPPFGFAGANLDFFPLGPIARRTGIVHIRRSTSDAPVYKIALRSFMRRLVQNHANLIWSIEGGRSRTGKLRPPRFGLLRYVVDAVDQLDTAEVQLVPVSILYDQLPTHEVDMMTAEALGHGKRPENARWFLGYVVGLRHRRGRMYVDFGAPIPLRQRLAELRADGTPEELVVERVALEVCHRINTATPVSPTAAVCIALLAVDRALTLDEILVTVAPLAAYLGSRGWPTAGATNLTDHATVRRAVQDLVESGVVTSYRGDTTVWGVAPHQHLTAAVYRNSAIHVLVHRAIAELVLVGAAERAGSFNSWEDSLALRDLLKFEFFFPGRAQYGRQLRLEMEIMLGREWPAVEVIPQAEAAAHLAGLKQAVSPLVLAPFLDAYAVVAAMLHQRGDEPGIEEAAFLQRCLAVGRQWALQRRISMESVSGEMFRTALRMAAHRGLVDGEVGRLRARRAAFVDEIDDYRSRMRSIAAATEQRL